MPCLQQTLQGLWRKKLFLQKLKVSQQPSQARSVPLHLLTEGDTHTKSMRLKQKKTLDPLMCSIVKAWTSPQSVEKSNLTATQSAHFVKVRIDTGAKCNVLPLTLLHHTDPTAHIDCSSIMAQTSWLMGCLNMDVQYLTTTP